MRNKITAHPGLIHAQDIKDICKPLTHLNISYFAHVNIDKAGQFSALTNNPGFTEHYLTEKYYNVDIHMSANNRFGDHVIWDALERCGASAKMHQEAANYGVRHTFTIIDKARNGTDYYHFATATESPFINQVYLNHMDLLKLFIKHFNDQVKQSRSLLHAYKLKFSIDRNAPGYLIHTDETLSCQESLRTGFLRALENSSIMDNSRHESFRHVIRHKDTLKPLALTRQQFNCFSMLMNGYSSKQIARALELSPRTVDNYLQHIRKLLGCHSGKEMISTYLSQAGGLAQIKGAD